MLEILIPILTTIIGAVLGSLGTFLIINTNISVKSKNGKKKKRKN